MVKEIYLLPEHISNSNLKNTASPIRRLTYNFNLYFHKAKSIYNDGTQFYELLNEEKEISIINKKLKNIYKENNFSSLFPNIYKSVIKDKKEYKISYEQIGRLSPGSEFDVWIKCPKGEDHIFKTPIARATSYSKKLSLVKQK